MVGQDSGTSSGFLGFRSMAAHYLPNNGNQYLHQQSNAMTEDNDEAMSIVSVASTHNFCGASNSHTAGIKQQCAVSVVSDLSSSSTVRDRDTELIEPEGSNEFVIECQNGEMIFVPSGLGRVIKSRCRHFRLLLATGRGGHVVVPLPTENSQESPVHQEKVEDNRIIKKNAWSIRTARHVIELLAEGTTSIENDQKWFADLTQACEEIDVRLCLASLVNYHDILDQASTFRFFDLIDTEKYQFKFQGIIKSWQWMHLLHRGILLLLKSKVLMLTVAPPTDGTALLPTSANSTKIVTKVSPSSPNRQRLTKCDELCSEFCVYSNHGTKINALLTILDLLAKWKSIDENVNAKKNARMRGGRAPEEFKIVYKTRIGSLEQEDLNMLWRLTSASYTLSSPDELRYLLNRESSQNTTTNVHAPSSPKHITESSTTEVTTSSGSNDHDDGSNHSITSHESTDPASNSNKPVPSLSYLPISSRQLPTSAIMAVPKKYQHRTITGTSGMVLKHLFDPINSRKTRIDDSMLPACVLVSNPTPDTLGRFLNAASSTGGGVSKTVVEVGWDIVSASKTIYFVSSTSAAVKDVLKYLADYSNSAIVNDSESNSDFRLKQYVPSLTS